MKVAIIHDWLVTIAGAEKVLSEIISIYPDSDLYAVIDFLTPEQRKHISGKKAKTTFIQSLPKSQTKYRAYLALMPLAIEQVDLSSYDLIISSSHAVAKGVTTGPNQLHICYCHSPIRYAWDMQPQYLKEANLERGIRSWIARYILHRIRQWDHRTANGVDHFVANSGYIARRIWKTYRRESTVIYPNVAVEEFTQQNKKEEFYLTASRMVPYKKIDLIVRAFAAMPDKKLIVIGDGPQLNKVKQSATSNISILGYQETPVLRDYMQRAKAFVFAAEEDFGITPVEAQACGTPVIAYGKGGSLETVIDGKTGILFSMQSEDSICEAVHRFENHFTPDYHMIRQNAERFSTAVFKRRFKEFAENTYSEFLLSRTKTIASQE